MTMSLKTIVASCVIAVALTAPAPAVPATRDSASQTSAPQTSAPVPLLWKVSDADNAIYLLGSFHLLKPADYPLSKEVDAAFADAEAVVFEMSPEEMASPTLALQMGQAALRSDGTQLDSELPSATAAKLHAWLAANDADVRASGLPPELLQNFEPWFVGLTISIIEMTREGLDPKLGLDQHFATAAKAAGKPTAGLETGAQQIAFLDGMGKDEQLQFLAESLDESGKGRRELHELHRAWRAGDAATLWKGMAADMKRQYPQLYRHINIERNDAWLPKLEQRLHAPGKDDTLVVVGALHLLGSDGVVEKLRGKGYKVERICSACAGASPE
jgi:uncharacterized protein YbaP (TraB family)